MIAAICIAGATPAIAAPDMSSPMKGWAAPTAGTLDRSFGTNGRAVATKPALPPSGIDEDGDVEFGLAAGPDGEVIAYGGSHTLVKFSPQGHMDRDFGNQGRLTVTAPEGSGFKLAAVAIDSQGRVVVAGTTRPVPVVSTPGPPEYPGPPRAWATVLRYLSDGAPDPSFGVDGRVETNLGLPPPAPSPSWSSQGPFVYEVPSVEASGLAIDSEDRPVFTGTWVTKVVRCYPFLATTDYTGAYVGRLTISGALDSSFNGTGIEQEPDASSIGAEAFTPSGTILYTAFSGQCLRGAEPGQALEGVGPDGGGNLRFGSGGAIGLAGFIGPRLAVDRRGRILIFGSYVPPRSTFEPSYRLVRLLADGAIDSDFGGHGSTTVRIQKRAFLTGLAVDSHERPVVVGAASKSAVSSRTWTFLLKRMTSAGKLDRSFGRAGQVKTRFGVRSSAVALDAVVDRRGRIVVGGEVSSPSLPTHSGFALARYLSGP